MGRLALVAALVTLALGATLRLHLAGLDAPGAFAFLRHAHSHLGIYGALVPAWLLVCRDAGLRLPPRRALAGYAACVVVATVGFALQGYAPLSIAASTGVLAVWLFAAARQTRGLSTRLRARGWLPATPVALTVASLLIPFVALAPTRWPAQAQPLAHAFVALLLLGVFAPAALHRLGARPPPAWAVLAVAVPAAISLGLRPSPLLLPFEAVAGAALVVGALAASRARPEERAALAVVGIGLAVHPLLPRVHDLDIAGVHALVLGPLALAFAPPAVPRAVRLVWLALVAAMSAALVAAPPTPERARAVAALGIALVGVAASAAVWTWARALRARGGEPCPAV